MTAFKGFEPPNYTQTPNKFFELIPFMKEAELKCTLVVIRETFGWHREAVKLTVPELMKLTGLSKQSVLNGCNSGVERGTLIQTSENPDGKGPYSYTPNVNYFDPEGSKFLTVSKKRKRVKNLDWCGLKFRLPEVKNLDPQQALNNFQESAFPGLKESIKETSKKRSEYVLLNPEISPMGQNSGNPFKPSSGKKNTSKSAKGNDQRSSKSSGGGQPPKPEPDPLEKNRSQVKGILGTAFGWGLFNKYQSMVAKVPRQKWLDLHLDRVIELREQAKTDWEAAGSKDPKYRLCDLLDAEVRQGMRPHQSQTPDTNTEGWFNY